MARVATVRAAGPKPEDLLLYTASEKKGTTLDDREAWWATLRRVVRFFAIALLALVAIAAFAYAQSLVRA